jgi:hypothetical protein
MRYVIKIVAPANGRCGSSYDGQYVKTFDVEAHGGRGYLEVTADPKKALHFASLELATLFTMRSPTCAPRRPDGGHNRPLTFFTTLIEPLPG